MEKIPRSVGTGLHSARLCVACCLATVMSLAAPAAAGAAGASALTQTQDPSQLVEKVARQFLGDVAAHRDAYRKDPAQLREAVDRDVLPFFDMQRVAQLVLGQHWRTATPGQRRRFTDAFEKSMLANYGNAIVNFRSDKLKVFPSRVSPDDTFTVVRTEIKLDSGSTSTVSYALHKGPGGWKAWDVVVDGISYVKSFRDDIGSEIDQKGLDAVIAHLQQGEKPRALGGHGGGP